MVAAEVGEGRNVDIETIETMLGQAVAAGLDCQMGHAGCGERLQRGMEADGVRRGQRRQAVHASLHLARVVALQAERADRRGVPGHAGPDLAQEFHGRGLAVGAGDGGDHAGLPPPVSCGRTRQFEARRPAGQDRHAAFGQLGQRRVGFALVGQDGDGAGLDGGGGIVAAVAAAALEGDEHVARRHVAGITADTGHIDHADALRIGVCGDRARNKISKMQGSSPLCRS